MNFFTPRGNIFTKKIFFLSFKSKTNIDYSSSTYNKVKKLIILNRPDFFQVTISKYNIHSTGNENSIISNIVYGNTQGRIII